MITKPRILFVYQQMASFIKTDFEILGKHYDLISYEYKIRKNAGKDLISWMAGHRNDFDLVFIWFGDVHATVAVATAKSLGKKSIIVAGGYDTATLPEIGYGYLSKGRNRLNAFLHFSVADRILVVDDSLKRNLIDNLGVSVKNTVTVPTGYDSDFWSPGKNTAKERLALTVGLADDISRVKLKGMDTVREVAASLPDVRFEIIGLQGKILDDYLSGAPSNLSVLPPMPRDELLGHYRKAKAYLQLSMAEGLPNSLCEAMLCECVPVGTRAGGIPTAIGETGFLVPHGDVATAADAVVKAIESDNGRIARERISGLFTIEKREKSLVEIINKLLRIP